MFTLMFTGPVSSETLGLFATTRAARLAALPFLIERRYGVKTRFGVDIVDASGARVDEAQVERLHAYAKNVAYCIDASYNDHRDF